MTTITAEDISYLAAHPNNADGEDIVQLCQKITELQAEVERLSGLNRIAAQAVSNITVERDQIKSWKESATKWLIKNADHAGDCTGFMSVINDDGEADTACTCGIRELLPTFDSDLLVDKSPPLSGESEHIVSSIETRTSTYSLRR